MLRIALLISSCVSLWFSQIIKILTRRLVDVKDEFTVDSYFVLSFLGLWEVGTPTPCSSFRGLPKGILTTCPHWRYNWERAALPRNLFCSSLLIGTASCRWHKVSAHKTFADKHKEGEEERQKWFNLHGFPVLICIFISSTLSLIHWIHIKCLLNARSVGHWR